MFKQLLITLTALSMSTLIFAEPVKVDKTVVCDSAKEMISHFDTKYAERPIWVGVYEEDKNATVLVNMETQTWSMIVFRMKDDVACLVESGKGFKFKMPESGGGTL